MGAPLTWPPTPRNLLNPLESTADIETIVCCIVFGEMLWSSVFLGKSNDIYTMLLDSVEDIEFPTNEKWLIPR